MNDPQHVAPPILVQPTLHGELLAVRAPTQVWSGADGTMGAASIHGAIHSDVRLVRGLEVTVAGRAPEHLATTTRGPGRIEIRSMVRGLDTGDADPDVLITKMREVDGRGWTETLIVKTRKSRALSAALVYRIVPDATYIDAVKAGARPTPPEHITVTAEGAAWEGQGVSASLVAGDFIARMDGTDVILEARVEVPAGGAVSASWRLNAHDAQTPVRQSTAPMDVEPPDMTGLDPRLRLWVKASMEDLDALRMSLSREPRWQFLAAGAPWYCTLFGRDSIWAARMLLPYGVRLAADTLHVLAALQGNSIDPADAEEPGKILHELRRDELIAEDATVLPPLYYGTVDATPLWICLLHETWKAGLSDDETREFLPNLRSALSWMRDYGDADGDGLISYVDASGHGLANQGWKDSHDGVQWADGRPAVAPIALCEVQAYAFDAAVRGAELLETLDGAVHEAAAWRQWAESVRTSFHEHFWIEEPALTGELGSYPAIAVDALKQPVDSLASNIGHLLGTGILDADQSRRVAMRLGSPQLDSGYGLRTLATGAAGYWPLSYHAGSVWPHDTAIAVRGLVAEGHDDVAAALIAGLIEAASAFGYRIPELYSGDGIDVVGKPVPYPAACRPQAWSAAASVAVATAARTIADRNRG